MSFDILKVFSYFKVSMAFQEFYGELANIEMLLWYMSVPFTYFAWMKLFTGCLLPTSHNNPRPTQGLPAFIKPPSFLQPFFLSRA